jgi:hypothetical protein
MSTRRTLRLVALCLSTTLVVTLPGCGGSASQAGSVEVGQASTKPVIVPTVGDPSQAVARSAARWDHKVAGDWIQVYDFVLPDLRRGQSLGRFLTDKEYHVYENPTKPLLLGVRDKLAFIEVTVLWTPLHPIVLSANNLESAEELRQELPIVETWVFAQGQWYWMKEERQREFFDENPDILPSGR